MNFSKEGQGPVVVLSHALALDRGMWSDVAAALTPHCTVVRYDHRGHGEATGAIDPFSIEDLADDAADLIREVSSDPVVFVGLSLGGMVGQALAARHPALLRGLAVLNSAAHYPDRSTWDARILAVREGGMQAIADSSIERWLTPAFRQSPAGQAMAGRLREVLLRTDPLAYTRTCEAIAGMDLRPGNRRIENPTLIVAGRQDMATPPAMSQAMAKDIASARVVEVEAAHISAAEIPGELASLLDDWIRALPA
ncbi:alpha/beta fold hydrolase [Variovorax guangxiensis]|uniref:alpha/beta fold hydrolase n=1 Tax=Variovorax guangxiensis TaxID=1775474 RepID=UPI00285952DB|nr:alpha/beta fold hydrolase [Variovorax guangxiensis]MDR6860746.1 3-oxoadipate enol-lactonase [Variovorax guangxiensis]